MSFSLPFGFGLATPALLAISPLLIGLLVYAYRRRNKRDPIVVATTFILKQLQRPPASPRKFLPPPRFFFELLLLTLILAAAAGAYRESPSARRTIVVDNSFSMAALDVGVSSRLSLLEQAITQAKDAVRSSGAGTTFRIMTTAPSLASLSGEFVTASEAGALLDGIRLRYAGDRLERELGKLLAEPAAGRIEIFTDHEALSAGFPSLKIRTVGGGRERPLQNIAIKEIQLRSSPDQQAQSTLRLELAAFTRQAVQAEVVLEQIDAQGKAASEPLARQTVNLAPGATLPVTFSGIRLPTSAAVKARVRTNDGPRIDAIAEDSTAWVASSGSGSRVLLVSPLSARELGLDQVSLASFEQTAPEKYDPESSGGLPHLFHRFAPGKLPAGRSLIIMPPQGGSLLQTAKEIQSAEITRWSESSPLLAYLHMPTLRPRLIRPFLPSPWAENLITSTAGALMIQGARGASEITAVGFELFPFEGRNSPATSILTLNLLKWLAQPTAPAGASAPSAGGSDTVRIDSHSPAKERADDAGTPGLYREGGRLRALNFYDQAESNLLEIRGLDGTGGLASASEENRQPLAALLAWICCAMILCDLLAAPLAKIAGAKSSLGRRGAA